MQNTSLKAIAVCLLLAGIVRGISGSDTDSGFSNLTRCQNVDSLHVWDLGIKIAAGGRTSLCRVRAPNNYTSHRFWPKCLWEVPSANIARAQEWTSTKADQHWVEVKETTLVFPRSGGSLPAADFLRLLGKTPGFKMEEVRTILDEGAGVCGLAAEIMSTYSHRPLVMSYAPAETHANQVEVCAERGLPAIHFKMGSHMFPVPHSSYDMVTCKWCWHWIAPLSIGQWLLEVDRVLKPGGHFAFVAIVHQSQNFYAQFHHWRHILGWKLLQHDFQFAVYKKPDLQAIQAIGKGSLLSETGLGGPSGAQSMPHCLAADLAQPTFHKYHMPCRNTHSVTELVAASLASSAVSPNITRLMLPVGAPAPPVSSYSGPLSEVDATSLAASILEAISDSGGPAPLGVLNGTPRNGALTAALLASPGPSQAHTWVMHVQSVSQVELNRQGHANFVDGVTNFVQSLGEDRLLSVMSKQGQLGLYHDWCYPFPTFPRAFDLIFFDAVVCKHWCFRHFIVELDRLVRPEGYIVLGDSSGRLNDTEVSHLGWEPVAIPIPPREQGTPIEATLSMWRKTREGPWVPEYRDTHVFHYTHIVHGVHEAHIVHTQGA